MIPYCMCDIIDESAQPERKINLDKSKSGSFGLVGIIHLFPEHANAFVPDASETKFGCSNLF